MTDPDQPSCSYADSDSCDDSCFEVEGTVSPPKTKKAKLSKFSGAAKYKTRFNPDWTKEFPFISSVSGDQCRLANMKQLAKCCIYCYVHYTISGLKPKLSAHVDPCFYYVVKY